MAEWLNIGLGDKIRIIAEGEVVLRVDKTILAMVGGKPFTVIEDHHEGGVTVEKIEE